MVDSARGEMASIATEELRLHYEKKFVDEPKKYRNFHSHLHNIDVVTFLSGHKTVMTGREGIIAFLCYVFLVILLATILIMTGHVEGSKHAFEIFRS